MYIPTLQEALKLDKDGIRELKANLTQAIKQSNLNAYVGDLQDYN